MRNEKGEFTSSNIIDCTKEEALDIIRKYPTRDAYRNAPKRPSIKKLEYWYGSWTNARIAAGIETPVFKRVCNWHCSNKKTYFYFIYFPDLDFYKIGITVNSLNRRFNGRPYEVIELVHFGTGIEAIEVENSWKASENVINQGESITSGQTITLDKQLMKSYNNVNLGYAE